MGMIENLIMFFLLLVEWRALNHIEHIDKLVYEHDQARQRRRAARQRIREQSKPTKAKALPPYTQDTKASDAPRPLPTSHKGQDPQRGI